MKENAITTYIKSAIEEFGKITWPTKEQAALLTGVVIIVSIIVSIMIGLVDFGFSEAYQFILDLI
jgi:preprotein translocase SecE subunit